MYDTFENLATDWKKRDWMIVLDVLFATFFKNWYNISSHLKSVTRNFQHANTDHIMIMSFIRIKFTDDTFNIILHEFSVCQVLISNENS